MSAEFMWLTFFFLINSFWANFYIGTFDMQLGDKHSLTPEQRHAFAQSFTLVITFGVLAIPPVGALMDRSGFPITALVCIVSGVIWSALLLIDSPTLHLLMASFVFYSIYRTALYTFFFAYLADVLGFRYFGMMGGIIFLLAGVLGMLQYPLALYGAGTCHVFTSDQSTCDQGQWAWVNTAMVVMILSTLYFVYQDYVRRDAALKAAQSTPLGQTGAGARIELTTTPYGAV
jgi:MFS family permease